MTSCRLAAYVVPVLFTAALALHYAQTLVDRSQREPLPAVGLSPGRVYLPPGLSTDIRETTLAPADTPPRATPGDSRSQTSRPATVARRATGRPPMPVTGTSEPPQSDGPSEIVVIGNSSGIHVQRRPLPPTQTASAAGTLPQIPTGGQLDGIEFTIEVSNGSIEDLVQNVDGAVFRGARLYDVRGEPVGSIARFTAGSRLVVFYAVDDGLAVVLPNTLVDAVLRHVALKAGGSALRRVVARFDASGTLTQVDVL